MLMHNWGGMQHMLTDNGCVACPAVAGTAHFEGRGHGQQQQGQATLRAVDMASVSGDSTSRARGTMASGSGGTALQRAGDMGQWQ